MRYAILIVALLASGCTHTSQYGGGYSADVGEALLAGNVAVANSLQDHTVFAIPPVVQTVR